MLVQIWQHQIGRNNFTMQKNINQKIQEEILQVLKKRTKCEFGRFVSELNYTYNQILQNVLQLKNKGKIYKPEGHKGYFLLKKNRTKLIQ